MKNGLRPIHRSPVLGKQLQQPSALNLVGVLRGDVNGSFSGPPGTLDLHATQADYFAQLGPRLGVPTDIWGV